MEARHERSEAAHTLKSEERLLPLAHLDGVSGVISII